MGWRDYDGYDGVFWAKDPMVSHFYEVPDLRHEYPPHIAQAIYAELEAEEQEAAKKTPPSTHSEE